jgi:hypothetical protein
MTKIERAIKQLDDLYQFYKKIPKINTSKKRNTQISRKR